MRPPAPVPDPSLFDTYASIEAYYSSKVRCHGPTARGVDWSCRATQELRFTRLLRVCDFRTPFSLNDIGCGYGALFGYLARCQPSATVDYLGIDLSSDMIAHARGLWSRRAGADFSCGVDAPRTADYALASGVFNVRLNNPAEAWERFIKATLVAMRESARRGFAVNFMAPREDEAKAAEVGLYRTPPRPWADFCRKKLACRVELVAGYGLREFTLLARPRGPDAGARRAPASMRGKASLHKT